MYESWFDKKHYGYYEVISPVEQRKQIKAIDKARKDLEIFRNSLKYGIFRTRQYLNRFGFVIQYRIVKIP